MTLSHTCPARAACRNRHRRGESSESSRGGESGDGPQRGPHTPRIPANQVNYQPPRAPLRLRAYRHPGPRGHGSPCMVASYAPILARDYALCQFANAVDGGVDTASTMLSYQPVRIRHARADARMRRNARRSSWIGEGLAPLFRRDPSSRADASLSR